MRKKLGDKKTPFLATQPNRYCGTKEQSLGDFRRTYWNPTSPRGVVLFIVLKLYSSQLWGLN